MFGGVANSLVPYSAPGYNGWRSPYAAGNSNRRYYSRYPSQYAQGAFGSSFGRSPHHRGYAFPRTRISRPLGMRGYPTSYPRGYWGGLAQRQPMYSRYGPGFSPYRKPYTGSGYGTRPKLGYRKPSWNTLYRRPQMMQRGYPPSSRRRDMYRSPWYNDNPYLDDDDDDEEEDEDEDDDELYDPYNDSEDDDPQYGAGNERYRAYATDYDDSDGGEDWDDEDLEDEDETDWDDDDRFASNSYRPYRYKYARDDW